MLVPELNSDVDVNTQIVKITEELGEVIKSIKIGESDRIIRSEINDVIQACFTLHFMLSKPADVLKSWNVHHMNKILDRSRNNVAVITKIHKF